MNFEVTMGSCSGTKVTGGGWGKGAGERRDQVIGPSGDLVIGPSGDLVIGPSGDLKTI
jgi:hypothetical protein